LRDVANHLASPLASQVGSHVGSFDVLRVGDGRVRIKARPPGAASVRGLMSWLADRDEVIEVSYRERTGALDVRYREARGDSGAFIRSLRDRIFTLTRPDAPRGFRVELAHALDDRARLRLVGATDDEVLRLAAWLAGQPGIARANASPASRSVVVVFHPETTSAQLVLASIAEVDPAEWPAAPTAPSRTGWRVAALNTVVFATAVAGILPVPAVSAAVALTAFPSAKRALRAARERRLSVDVLDLAAIGISLGTGQPQTAAFITWLLGIGDLVLERTADRARHAISKLMKLDATDAWRIRVGTEQVERVAPHKLSLRDRIVVETGGRVAADGIVLSGAALVDEKALTGESIPQERHKGDRVLAATVVLEGQIIVEVERAGRDTTAAKIVRILEGAGAKPMTLQRETEKIADRLVVPTFAVAGGAAAIASELDRMTSVLITDFGTGIRIVVPTSALTAMTLAARAGVLVKGAQYLERLAKADIVVFDKTGTLTGGEPEVFEVVAVGRKPAREAMALAAAAEARQRHPVAEAIRRYATRASLDVREAVLGSEQYSVGLGLAARVGAHDVLVGGRRLMLARGIDIARARASFERHSASGVSSICVAVDGWLEAVIGYADEPRRESREVVTALKAGGRRRVLLMSGDARAPVEAIARAVGVDEAFGELLPEDKAKRVRELQRVGKVVAMVGDGINDAPALALADVGISLQGGTDVALETADVVLLDGGLLKLPDAFRVADDAMRHVRRGLGLVIAPNAIAIALGALGLLTPGAAALVNNGSTVVAALAAVAPLLRGHAVSSEV
jgi:heavy metal translocating P-type ATPase